MLWESEAVQLIFPLHGGTRWGGAATGCLSSPLGHVAVQTNWPQASVLMGSRLGAQRPKSCFGFFFFFPSFLPSSLSYSSSSFTRLTHTPAEGCTSIIPNRPENIPCSFSLLQCSHTTALFDDVPVSPPHQRWPPWLSRAARPHWSPLISADALSHHFHMLSPVAPPPPSSLTCYFLHTVAAPEFRADSRIVRDLCLKRKKLKNHVRIHQKMLMNVNQVGGSLDSSLFQQGIYLEVLMLLLM